MDAASEANLYRMYEKRQYDATRQRPVLPVTIVTGFLGAGKTTLLRKILQSKHNLRIAVVVNEYGSVDHDGGVLERDGQTDSVDKLMGGCVCCQVSVGGEFEEKVGELLRRPDHAEDRYDYLVIETSGVSDPESIVRALDKTFGKLTRARLDSVVTVVDADSLLHQLEQQEGRQRRGGVGGEGRTGGGGGGGLLVSMRRQLENADVILLNKADLVEESGLSKLSAEVARVNPAARVECCSYGKVPLHSVLDVEAPQTDIQGVSHERVKVHLSVSSKGGNLRTAASSSSSSSRVRIATSSPSSSSLSSMPTQHLEGGATASANRTRGHLRDDGLGQVTFTSSVPLSLARFQDWVCYGMPAGVVRVKGVLAFEEDRLTRSVFNMSGRRRLSFESDGNWQGPMSLYLVVIGVDIDEAEVLATLEGMRVESSLLHGSSKYPYGGGAAAPACEEEAARLMKLLEGDDLFDAVPRQAAPACAPNVVRFRFTGAGAYGIPPSQLSIKFGVNLDAINRSILRAVNNGGSAPRSFTTSTKSEPSRPDRVGNGARSEANGIASDSSAGDGSSASAGQDTIAPAVEAGGKGAAGTSSGEKIERVFLTSQEGVHVRGDQARGGRDEECVALRYAVGGSGSVSLADAWPMLVERAREVMQTELGHVHFCSCFS
eukprot:g12074.t1